MPIRNNPVKEKLAAGGDAYGTMIFEFLSPGLPQIAANAGAEFLFYDMEHSGFDFEQIKMQCALCRGLGIVPMVRPPAKQYQFTSRLLDIGAMGLLFQMVESAEEAEELVRWTRYPPRGDRGAIFGGAHDDYLTTDMAQAVAEALFAGVPIVACAAGGVPEVVGDCGLLVPVGDHEALRRALRQALAGDHPPVAAGRARAEQRFSVAAMVAGTERVYQDLI